MAIFLILVGTFFFAMVFLNVREGLDMKWLVWTLTTIGVLVGVLYLASYIDCQTNRSGYCGMVIALVWVYAAPVALALQQYFHWMRKRKPVLK